MIKIVVMLNSNSFSIHRGSLHESGLSYNPDRSHSVSVKTIGLNYICLHK